MAYRIRDGLLGSQPIADTSATQQHPLGTIVNAADLTYGEGEFIYLLGVAATVVGSVVNWRPTTYQTALGVVGVNNSAPIAIAMSANVAGKYGWYQISGYAVAAKSSAVSFAAAARVAAATASGLVIVSASAAGLDIEGAVIAAVASAAAGRTTVALQINRPRIQGRVA